MWVVVGVVVVGRESCPFGGGGGWWVTLGFTAGPGGLSLNACGAVR